VILILITKTVNIKWSSNNKKYYENKGYIFTKMGNEFEVKVEDLTNSSGVKVDIECDGCGKPLKGIQWNEYRKNYEKRSKYYCRNCASNLYGSEKSKLTQLENSKSFYQWCYENLLKDEANIIILR